MVAESVGRISLLIPHYLTARKRFLQSADYGGIPAIVMLRHCHYAGAKAGAAYLSILRRGRQQEHIADDMDICPCRGFCTKRQANGGYRRHGKPDPAHTPGQPAAGRYFHRRLLYLIIYRYKCRDNRSADSSSRRAGGENRYRPALYSGRRGGRFVFRRQPLVHIGHHDCVYKDTGLRNER